MDSPLVSIVIVNYNGLKYLGACFDSLYCGSYPNIEIILVDNGSIDASVEFVRSNYPKIRLIDNGANLGLAVASNRGAEAAHGEYIFFYNNDTIADKMLIEKLVAAMLGDPSLGICGCTTYTYDGAKVINQGVPCDIFGYPWGGGVVFYVDAAIFIRKSLFCQIGGFDERMFLYGEDRDICWRCWLLGYKVAVAEGASFRHNSACISENLSDYSTNINKRFLGEFNALRSLLKNYSGGFLALILPMFVSINIAEIMVFSLLGKRQVVRDVYIKSYRENFRHFRELLFLRRFIQRQRRISDFNLISRMNKISGKLRLLLDIGIPRVRTDVAYEK